ncbi:MAG: 3-hydroxyacyl-ACP dehydratase FabZ [Candidatus Omnitrophota bacterium]
MPLTLPLTNQDIRGIIPHRYPFLLIDRVTGLVPGETLTAVKNVSVNEQYFTGHFPDEKIMPGVLIIEAMAQAGCVFFYYSQKDPGPALMYYLGKVTARFLQPVRPGDQLMIRVEAVRMMANGAILKAEASVDGVRVSAVEFTLSIRPAL